MTHTFNLPEEFITRYKTFIEWTRNNPLPPYCKSIYWEKQSSEITINAGDDTITVSGKSGYYIPPLAGESNTIKCLYRTARRLYPTKLKMMTFEEAFDAVMRHDPIADIDLSPHRLNFRYLATKGACRSIRDLKLRYFAQHKYELNHSMIYAHYLLNIIRDYFKDRPHSIMEIGAGNGNLASLLYDTYMPKMVIVDLPEVMLLSMPFIADLFPKAKILMPHEEITSKDLDSYNFYFLTPAQVEQIGDNSIDLTVCVNAFQEMTHKQIREHFDLVNRVCKNNGKFLVVSRSEKIPAVNLLKKESTVPVNRFHEYPWRVGNKVLVNEECKLLRLVDIVNSCIRLEEVRK